MSRRKDFELKMQRVSGNEFSPAGSFDSSPLLANSDGDDQSSLFERVFERVRRGIEHFVEEDDVASAKTDDEEDINYPSIVPIKENPEYLPPFDTIITELNLIRDDLLFLTELEATSYNMAFFNQPKQRLSESNVIDIYIKLLKYEEGKKVWEKFEQELFSIIGDGIKCFSEKQSLLRSYIDNLSPLIGLCKVDEIPTIVFFQLKIADHIAPCLKSILEDKHLPDSEKLRWLSKHLNKEKTCVKMALSNIELSPIVDKIVESQQNLSPKTEQNNVTRDRKKFLERIQGNTQKTSSIVARGPTTSLFPSPKPPKEQAAPIVESNYGLQFDFEL